MCICGLYMGMFSLLWVPTGWEASDSLGAGVVGDRDMSSGTPEE